MGLKPVDPLIDNFGNLANSGKVKFWTSSSPILTLPKACHFLNMCRGPKPVDSLIDNFSNLANSGKVKFWTHIHIVAIAVLGTPSIDKQINNQQIWVCQCF